MNILIVTQYFWPEEFRINDLAEEMISRGHAVTVLCGTPNYPSGCFFPGYNWFRRTSEVYKGANVIRIPQFARKDAGAFRLLLNYMSFAVFASILSPFRCRGQYDVIFVHEPSPITVGIPAIVMKWIKGAPILFWVLDIWPESLSAAGNIRSKHILGIVDSLVRFIYKRCDRILIQSHEFMSRITRYDIDKSKISYFPNWAEKIFVPTPYPVQLLEELTLPGGFYVMFAGNIGLSQDIENILNAANITKDNPDIHWLIVGDGRMKGWAESKASESGLRDTVHFLGRHPMDRMPEFYALANVMLVSLKNKPVFSLTIPAKIQSYMACGKPIISMLNGEGARVIEESGAGISCTSESPNQLAHAVLSMQAMGKGEIESYGRKARAYYENNFSREVLFKNLEKWMELSVSSSIK